MTKNDAVSAALEIKRKAEKDRSDYERNTTALITELKASRSKGLVALKLAVMDAEKALLAAKDAAVTLHPWEGKKVTRTVKEKVNPWSSRETTKIEEGIVETVTSKTVFSGTIADWRKPSIGSVIVRDIKADGTAALRFFGEIDASHVPWSLVG